MSTPLINSITWLEPLQPSPGWPTELLAQADEMLRQAGRLEGLIAPATRRRLGKLLRVTGSFYSNLIEGQFTEPLALADGRKRQPKELNELAATHIVVQRIFERMLDRTPELTWQDMFAPVLLQSLHRALFTHASTQHLLLADGSAMTPGQLRSEDQRDVQVGQHPAPSWQIVQRMLERMQQSYGQLKDPRQRLLAALACHHRLAWVHPFADGNGRVVRLLTHLQLHYLKLDSPLWSLSRGLARRHADYYARLAAADQPRRGDLDGRGQLTQSGLIEFVRFMLECCLDQMQYIEQCLNLKNLRERLDRIVTLEPRFIEAGIRPDAARALHILISQGEVSRADFKIYLGCSDRLATDQLRKLVELGVVEATSPKSRILHPGLPVWFAQILFPDLHRRFAG